MKKPACPRDPEPVTKSVRRRAGPGSSGEITVLLAEDNDGVRQSLCRVLQSARCFRVVGQAKNGQDVVALERKLRPDVILMDIAMPVLDGIRATKRILIVNPEARVIVLSTHSDEEYVNYVAQIGAAGFLEKQRAGEVLAKMIRKVLNGGGFSVLRG